jgi:large subunit ribosomal protein L25
LIVLQSLESLKVRALPKDLPDSLDVSILELSEPGQGVTIGDITIPSGVELVEDNPEITIASVYEPSALAAANDAAGGDAEEEVAPEEGEEGAEGDETGEAQTEGDKPQDESKQPNVDTNKK